MRIVSLNTWKNEGDYPRRLRLMGDGLAALRPDVVCLQECFVGAGSDTAAAISGRLDLVLHAAPARQKRRRHGDRLVESASGLAILARSGGPSEAIDLPEDPDDGQRIAQRLDLTVDGRPLRILNLHLSHLGGARGAALRAVQLEVALAWAERDLSGGLVLAGDLNAGAEAVELAQLGLASRPSTLQSARVGGSIHAGPAIDHCHLRRAGGWRVQQVCQALDEADESGWRPSDHKAVLMDVNPV
jgi:endonuclease/exonuclease/phosphatase family metal-dependent hydrolase